MAEPTTASVHHLGHVARGGLIGLSGAAVSAVFSFAQVIVVTRGFTLSDAGVFFAATSVFLVLSTLASLGTDTGLARFLLRYEAQNRHSDVRRVLWVAAVPVVVLALVLAAVLWSASNSLNTAFGLGHGGGQLLRALALLLPFAVVSDLVLSAMRAFGRMGSTAVVDRLLRTGLQTVAAVVVVVVHGGLLWLSISWGLAYVVSALVGVGVLARFLDHRLVATASVPGPVAREFWAFNWPRGLSKLSQIGIQKADIVIVAALLNPTDAAIYTAATRFVPLGQVVTQALQQVLQPRFTAILLKEDRDTLREVYRVSTAWTMLLTWPVYLVIGCAPVAYLSIFGGHYSAAGGAGEVVVVMMISMLLAVASGSIDTLLLMAGRSRTSLINSVSALVIDIAGCFLLVPRLGIAGAAIAWSAAVLTRCGLAYLQVRHQLGVVPLGRAVFAAAGLALVVLALPMTAYSLLFRNHPSAWPFVAAVIGLVYVAGLLRLRSVLCLDLLTAALVRPRGTSRGSNSRMDVRQVLTSLRNRLPGTVANWGRSAALVWGKLTAGLRMTPSIVIVGAQRTGTTTLYRLLEEHPDLVRPTLSKGTGYFDDFYDRGPRWYRAHFPLRALAQRRAHNGEVATFESSGYYMFHPLAAQRIARDLPDARIVVVVRDPVERAYSSYQHELARGFESLSFADALSLETFRTFGEAERLATDPAYTSFEHRHHSYRGRGQYDEQVARLIEAVGRDRVYVMDADAFFAEPVHEFAELQEWLGLEVWNPQEVAQWNARPRAPMPADLRDDLTRHFAPHDEALARLLGREPTWRVPQRVKESQS